MCLGVKSCGARAVGQQKLKLASWCVPGGQPYHSQQPNQRCLHIEVVGDRRTEGARLRSLGDGVAAARMHCATQEQPGTLQKVIDPDPTADTRTPCL